MENQNDPNKSLDFTTFKGGQSNSQQKDCHTLDSCNYVNFEIFQTKSQDFYLIHNDNIALSTTKYFG